MAADCINRIFDAIIVSTLLFLFTSYLQKHTGEAFKNVHNAHKVLEARDLLLLTSAYHSTHYLHLLLS